MDGLRYHNQRHSLYRGKREEEEPLIKHLYSAWLGEQAGRRGTGRPNLSRETNFSGANGDDRGTFIFSFQLTTSKIGNHTV